MHIILGSQSQGRRELLATMGYTFAVMPAHIDERAIRSEDSGALTLALAHAGLGYALACGGDPERGLQSLEQAQRLSPRDPFLAIYAPTPEYPYYSSVRRGWRPQEEVCSFAASMLNRTRHVCVDRKEHRIYDTRQCRH